MFRKNKEKTPREWKLNVKCDNCGNKFTLKSAKDILRVTCLSGPLLNYKEFFISSCPKCYCINTIPKLLIKKEIRHNCLNLCD